MPAELEAGRDLDVRIAGLLGWTAVAKRPVPIHAVWATGEEDEWFGLPPEEHGHRTAVFWLVPHFSTDIAAAWQVVERLRGIGWLVTVKDMPDGYPFLAGDDWLTDPKLWHRAVCELMFVKREAADGTIDPRFWTRPWAAGDTPAEAICRAALAALEADHAR